MTTPSRGTGGASVSRVAVLGESLVDLTPIVAEDGSPDMVPMPGGSPYNVAIGLARMGVATWFCGRMSSDPYGALLTDHLDVNGVSTELITKTPDPSAVAFVTHHDGDAIYLFRWDGTADRLLQPGDIDVDRLATMDAVHFGSVSLGLAPGSDVIMEVVRKLRGRVTLSFDPNVRMEMVSDRKESRARVLEAFALAQIAKASERDLDALQLSPTEVVSVRRTAGIEAPLLLTRGGSGQELWYADGLVVSTGPSANGPVVDTVGAGDAFMSAVIAGLATLGGLALGAPPEEIRWDTVVRFATAAAAITCGRRGADPPSSGEILAYLARPPRTALRRW
jgi:fructokinase